MKWTTKSGQTISVADMDDTHVANTVSMLRMKNGNRKILELILKGVEAFEKENAEFVKNMDNNLEPQGEIAQLIHDQMLDEMYDECDDEPW